MKGVIAAFACLIAVAAAHAYGGVFRNADCDHQCGHGLECNVLRQHKYCEKGTYHHPGRCYDGNLYTCVKRGFVVVPKKAYYAAPYKVASDYHPAKGHGYYPRRDYGYYPRGHNFLFGNNFY